jgi:hypothetical protein
LGTQIIRKGKGTPITQSEIITAAYALLEQDSTGTWTSGDDEYTTAQTFFNMGIGRWEVYQNTTWRELWKQLSDAASTLGGDTSTSASVSDYDCPSDMIRPGGWVTTAASDTTATHIFWTVKQPEDVGGLANSDDYYCWFTGNKNTGWDLHFNPRITLTAGQTIDYPYYKTASTSSATSFVPEMGDPYYLAYFIAAHMSEEGINADFFNMSEEKLDNMRTANMSGVWGVPSTVEGVFDGFGDVGNTIVSSTNQTGR